MTDVSSCSDLRSAGARGLGRPGPAAGGAWPLIPRVGAGPALLRAKWGYGRPWSGGVWQESSTKPGAMADMGVRLLGGGLITSELRAQYRAFAPSTVEISGIPGRQSIDYRTWFVGAGLVVRP